MRLHRHERSHEHFPRWFSEVVEKVSDGGLEVKAKISCNGALSDFFLSAAPGGLPDHPLRNSFFFLFALKTDGLPCFFFFQKLPETPPYGWEPPHEGAK